MPGKITLSDSDQVYASGFGLLFNYPSSITATERSIRTIATSDPLFVLLNTNKFYVRTEARSGADLFGFAGIKPADTISFGNPVDAGAAGLSKRRALQYGSLYTRGLRLFKDTVFGNSRVIPSSFREREADHYTYSGCVSDVSSEVASSSTVVTTKFGDVTCRSNPAGAYYQGKVISILPLVIQPIPILYLSRYSVDLRAVLDYFTSAPLTSTDVLRNTSMTLTHFEYQLTSDALHAKYHVTWWSKPPSYCVDDAGEWWSEVTYDFRTFSESMRIPVTDSTYTVRAMLQSPTFHFYGYRRDTSVPVCGSTVEGPSDYWFPASGSRPISVMLSLPTYIPSPVRADLSRNVPSLLFKSGPLVYFKREIQKQWLDISASAIFSAVAAFQDLEGSLDVNILQNLQKLPLLAEAIPDIKRLVNVVKSLRQGVAPKSLKDLMDALTSEELRYSFMIRPYGKVVNEYLPQLAAFVGELDSGFVRSGYGSFSTQLPQGSLGRESVHLTTRTKVVMDCSLKGLLSTICGLDAIGLLPKMSNLADLYPLSFVLNWFTGTLSSMRRAETAILMIDLPAYYVITYLITSPFTSSEMETYKLSNTSDDPLSMRVFVRDVTDVAPLPRDSRFGFGQPSGLPPLGTLGSLLWQLIFS